jgi:hypothetical protein
MVIGDETAIYHAMSRTALDGFPLGDFEKDFLLDLLYGFRHHRIKGVCVGKLPTVQAFILLKA